MAGAYTREIRELMGQKATNHQRMNDFGERGVKSNGADKAAIAGMATLLWIMQVLNVDMEALKEEA
ncbi:hypothetical protein [Bacillus safensis]|uniref:Uncharacterized protein n=1 Tax=Bacillus safensis TaxID=561879 RepID=A0AC61YQB4_BACIA|nr:hypothetical protein P5627_14645 [Bacillus safensis]